MLLSENKLRKTALLNYSAITEDGARVTLENDRDARISFDSSLNMV